MHQPRYDLFAFGFKKRTGKDFACKYMQLILEQSGHVVKVESFANALKDVAYLLYAWAGVMPREWYQDRGDLPEDREVVLPKLGFSYRELLLRLGTNAVRDQVHESTWVEIVRHNILLNHQRGIITLLSDVRFPNELEIVKELGGAAIHMHRPDLQPVDDVADCALNDYEHEFDYTIAANSGQLDVIKSGVAQILHGCGNINDHTLGGILRAV